jgi:hypothetical protein
MVLLRTRLVQEAQVSATSGTRHFPFPPEQALGSLPSPAASLATASGARRASMAGTVGSSAPLPTGAAASARCAPPLLFRGTIGTAGTVVVRHLHYLRPQRPPRVPDFLSYPGMAMPTSASKTVAMVIKERTGISCLPLRTTPTQRTTLRILKIPRTPIRNLKRATAPKMAQLL